MPRLSAATPKYRKHRASGQAVVTIQGRDHYLGPFGTRASKLEFDRLVGEWLAAGRPNGATPAPTVIRVTEVIAAFWRFAKSYYRRRGRATGTADNYRPALSWLRRIYGHTPATEFGPLALKALQAQMVAADHSRRYVNDNIGRIKRVFRWAASEELIPAAIPQALANVEGLRKGLSDARETAPVMPVASSVVEATLPFLPAVVADMVRLQRLTGARPGEICQIRPCDVDRSGEIWKYVPAEHKTEHHGHGRVIFLGPQAQQVLSPYLLREASAFCFSPVQSERNRRYERHLKRTTPLSCGNRPGVNQRRRPQRAAGDRYTNDSYRRAIHRACEMAFAMPKELCHINENLPKDKRADLRRKSAEWRREHCWSPHQLRHSAATEIRRKFGLEAAQAILGHARMNVTEIYAEKNEELAARVARDVG